MNRLDGKTVDQCKDICSSTTGCKMITHGTWGGVEDACVLCSSGASLLSADHSDWATTYSSKDKVYSTNAIIFCNYALYNRIKFILL